MSDPRDQCQAAWAERYAFERELGQGGMAAAGRRDKGQQILDSLLVLNRSRPVDPALVAALEVGLGNSEEALSWLERAYAERSQLLLFLLGPHPAFDALRGNPRFQELRRKAGFK